MYLQNLLNQRPEFIDTIVSLHQDGQIPTNSWVIDLDQIARNARHFVKKAEELDLKMYLMSKQHNRNPYINHIAAHCGLRKIVAVDAPCALLAHRYGVSVGHVGHLNQIPRHLTKQILEMNPEVITVYNLEHAQWINEEASRQGKNQDLLIRVYSDGDILFQGQEGGVKLDEIKSFVDTVRKMTHVRLVGVTAFPCLTYNESADEQPVLSPNVETIHKALDILRQCDITIEQVNMPGNTSTDVMGLLKEAGATHVEPGNGLLGTTPNNAFTNELSEQTAIAYVTEVSHYHDNRSYAFGGGVYHTSYTPEIFGLVGSVPGDIRSNFVKYRHDVPQDIDYHMQLIPSKNQRCEVGDSVVFVYRTQMHMTRSYAVPISGISTGNPKVHYIFDNGGNSLDQHLNPILPCEIIKDIEEIRHYY